MVDSLGKSLSGNLIYAAGRPDLGIISPAPVFIDKKIASATSNSDKSLFPPSVEEESQETNETLGYRGSVPETLG